MVYDQRVISVKEVARELEGQEDLLASWVKDNGNVFQLPSTNELLLVSEIFQVPHFQGLIRKQERLQGKAVADPFVIAKAGSIDNGCVITTENLKKNASQVPNVCEYFKIPYMNLEKFMEHEGWTF